MKILNNKKQEIASINEKLNETNEEIKQLQNDNKKVIKESNIKEAKLKEDINGINIQLKKIKYGTIPAENEKVFTLKKGGDDLLDLKNKNHI